jgi:hypothetical protein
MTYDEFLALVHEKHDSMAGEWRFGQAYFNTLHEVAPLIAAEVRGHVHDPFNRDKVNPMITSFVMERWDG